MSHSHYRPLIVINVLQDIEYPDCINPAAGGKSHEVYVVQDRRRDTPSAEMPEMPLLHPERKFEYRSIASIYRRIPFDEGMNAINHRMGVSATLTAIAVTRLIRSIPAAGAA